ncbi:MAG TPA: hypothetical protein VIM16_14190 [Mucilaginibacter sp.]
MKKVLSMIALAAICFGTVSASIPIRSVPDTGKVKTKFAHHTYKRKQKTFNKKVKTKIKDTTNKKY